MNNRPIVIFSIVLLTIIAGTMWFLQPSDKPLPEAPATPTPSVAPAPTVDAPPPVAPVARTVTPPASTQPSVPMIKEPAPRELTEWEMKIDQVLRSNANESDTAQMLINIFPGLPADGQTEAAQHIANLVMDKDYARVLPLVKNASLPSEVQDVLVTDLMNREDSVKLPTLLEIAKIPNHPYHEEALTDLQIFLDQDNGQNWAQWDSGVKDYLRKQASEDAAASNPEPPKQ